MRNAHRFDLAHKRTHPPTLEHRPSRRALEGAGRAACLDGVPLSDNPYPEHTAQHKDWERGHLLAFVERMCA